MAVAGVLDWQSTIATGAARDASAVAALRTALAGLQTAAGGAGRASDALALQMQREAAATASAAQQNKALAALVLVQARGDQQRYAIEAKGIAQRLAIEAKGEQDRISLAQRASAQLVAIEAKAAVQRERDETRAAGQLLKAEQKAQDARTKAAEKGEQDRTKAQHNAENERQASAEKAQAAVGALVDKVIAKVEEAAKYVVLQTVDFLRAGEEMAIASTAAHEVAVAQLAASVGSTAQAEVLYRQIKDLSYETGVDRQKTLVQLNKMLRAGFGEEGALAAIRAVNAESLGVSEQAGSRLAMALTKIQASGRAAVGDIRKLGPATGITVKEVTEEISKLTGKTIAETTFALKKGLVSAEVATKAIETVVQRSAGNVQTVVAQTIPRQIEQIKGRLAGLFDVGPEAMAPLKEVLASVLDIIKGPEGADLKDSIKELFTTLNDVLFKPLRGPEGRDLLRQFFQAGITTAHALTAVLKVLGPLISGIASAARSIIDIIPGLGGGIGQRAARPGFAAAAGTVGGDAVVPRMSVAAPPEAHALGKGIADGVAAGVREGQPGVLAAIEALISGGLLGGQKKAEVASPSALFKRELGYHMGAGVAAGMDSAQGLIAASSRAMVTGAQRAGTGAIGAGVGMGGGVTITIASLTIHASTRAGGERAAEGFYSRFRALAEGGA